MRDYKAEAAKLMEELPADWTVDPKHYRKYKTYGLDVLDSVG